MGQDDHADGFNRDEPLKSDLNSARYSAAALAASRSIALATTDSGNDGFITRDVALMTRMRGSPFAPKWRANVIHNSPRRLYGELMQISGPPVVANAGLSAAKTSLSGLLDPLDSSYQNAISSQMQATLVIPRFP
jgi:hypothetical protein